MKRLNFEVEPEALAAAVSEESRRSPEELERRVNAAGELMGHVSRLSKELFSTVLKIDETIQHDQQIQQTQQGHVKNLFSELEDLERQVQEARERLNKMKKNQETTNSNEEDQLRREEVCDAIDVVRLASDVNWCPDFREGMNQIGEIQIGERERIAISITQQIHAKSIATAKILEFNEKLSQLSPNMHQERVKSEEITEWSQILS